MKNVFTEERLLAIGKWGSLLLASVLLMIIQYQAVLEHSSFMVLIQESLLMNILLMIAMINVISFLELHVLLKSSHLNEKQMSFGILATVWLLQAVLMNFIVAISLGFGILMGHRSSEVSIGTRIKEVVFHKNGKWVIVNLLFFTGMIAVVYTSLFKVF